MSNFKDLVRLGKDAEVRYTQGGKAVAGFSAAFDTGWGDNKKTTWLDCSYWGERGEKSAPNLTKGTLILIEGDLGTREYEGKTYITLDVRDFKFAGSKPDSQSGGSSGSRGGAPQRQRPERATDAPSARETMDEFADDSIPFVTNRGVL